FAPAVELGRIRSLDRLCYSICGEHPEDHGHIGIQRRLTNSPTRLGADIVEMRRVASNDGSQTDNRVELPRSRHGACNDWNLEGTRHPDHFDVIGLDAVFR